MMGLTWSAVAVALTFTAAAPGDGNPGIIELKSALGKFRQISAEKPSGPEITYRIRLVEMEGLEWRETWFDQLIPVTRRGSATVWTASNRIAQPIVERCSKVVASPPKVTSSANAAAHFNSKTSRSLVTQVSWTGEEPKPSSEAIREGFAATIAGRKLDQGVLVQVVIDDTEIRSVHDFRVAHGSSGVTCHDANPKQTATVESSCCKDAKAAEPGSVVQIAEVASQEVVGEWLIPNEGFLLVGLGVHTASGKDGKAVVRERLMLIEATDPEVMRTAFRQDSAPSKPPLPSPSTIPAPVTPSPSTVPSPAPAPPAPAVNPMPTPNLPSRSLPQGLNADGTPADLPPLPEDADAIDTDDSADPHGTPQNKNKGQALPMPKPPMPDSKDKTIDSQASQAAYNSGIGRSLISGKSQWLPVKSRSLPASLDQWLVAIRRGASTPECGDCDASSCEDE